MSKAPRTAPGWCKWWMDRWSTSSLRRRLKTAAQRGIYRELWDICMSSPDPGAAVDSAGQPYTDSELAREIGCRKDHFEAVVRVLLAQGKITRGARLELRLSTSTTEMSLPDHWKYNRLHGAPSESGENKNAPNQSQSQSQKKNPPQPPPKPKPAPFDPKAVEIPPSLDTPEFRTAWGEWCDYRAKKRKPVSEAAVRKQFKRLSAIGPEAAVAAIDQAIASDWQGLFPDKQRSSPGRHIPAPTSGESYASVTKRFSNDQ